MMQATTSTPPSSLHRTSPDVGADSPAMSTMIEKLLAFDLHARVLREKLSSLVRDENSSFSSPFAITSDENDASSDDEMRAAEVRLKISRLRVLVFIFT